jgi:hypothetical protein
LIIDILDGNALTSKLLRFFSPSWTNGAQGVLDAGCPLCATKPKRPLTKCTGLLRVVVPSKGAKVADLKKSENPIPNLHTSVNALITPPF